MAAFTVLICVFFSLFLSNCTAWMNRADPPAQRAKALLAQMNLNEKLTMLKGTLGNYVGNIPENTRLGIPALKLNDGPQGFRDEAHPGTTTAFPSGLTIAASWDEQAVFDWGAAMGQEFFDKGSNIQLGPGMNVARVPVNGRNFEYLSGEDPYLGYVLVQPAIKGIQSKHVIANAKHFVNNNQEFNRNTMSANVDERTAFQIYYPPFEGAIEAEVGSFMCSYNKINSVYACENNVTLGHLRMKLGDE
jgi:beta-glucosidase